MVKMFKTILQNVEKPLTLREKNQKLITDIGGGWCLEKCEKGLPPLKRTEISKKAQERDDIIFKNFLNIIGGGIIGNSNCIGTSLNRLILNQTPKELNPIQFLQKSYILVIIIGQLIFLVILNLKELDIDDFYQRKQMNEEMESEMNKIDLTPEKKADSEDDSVDEAIPKWKHT